MTRKNLDKTAAREPLFRNGLAYGQTVTLSLKKQLEQQHDRATGRKANHDQSGIFPRGGVAQETHEKPLKRPPFPCSLSHFLKLGLGLQHPLQQRFL